MQIQISSLLQKPTDLDLHSLQRPGISGFSRTRVKYWDRETWANSIEPNQMYAAECSIWSGSTLFATHPAPFTGSKIDFFKDKYGKELRCPITKGIYSWLSLSRPRLSRITAYLEVKIWSLPIHENLTTDGKYCRKEEKLLLRSNFSPFPQYFQYISNFKSPITYQFVKCG